MAAKQKTYTIRNKMTGEIVGYWDGIPGNDEGIKAKLRQEFGQGRFQITYTGRKKVVDESGERWVTHPVNQFFVVGNAGVVSYHGGTAYLPPINQGGGEYREFILPFVTETRQAVSAMANDIAAMSDTLSIIRGNLESLMTEDEDGTFDDEGEKAGFGADGLEAIAKDPRYAWAIPLVIGGDKDLLINGVAEKLKEDPTLLHDFISKLVGGAMGGEE